MTEYHKAILHVIQRYQYTLLIDDEKIQAFMVEIAAGCTSNMPICKLNRWLGYVQGVLIERGVLTVEGERDATRPLFRPLDFPEK